MPKEIFRVLLHHNKVVINVKLLDQIINQKNEIFQFMIVNIMNPKKRNKSKTLQFKKSDMKNEIDENPIGDKFDRQILTFQTDMNKVKLTNNFRHFKHLLDELNNWRIIY